QLEPGRGEHDLFPDVAHRDAGAGRRRARIRRQRQHGDGLMTAVRRTSHRLERDPSRVIAKPYLPGEEIAPGVGTRAGLLMTRILAIPEDEVAVVLAETLALFRGRHRRLLIGAYFTNEYSIEGAALFNPSIVPAPDQSGTRPAEQRFVMSLRAVGEGHISSIEFRTGLIDAASNV